ncbi:MAG: hypothetical protein IPP74_07890 [Alphaproteobacteria bacterium]|nr:hypothetical protein [Alphaproteobacteria bacterium]
MRILAIFFIVVLSSLTQVFAADHPKHWPIKKKSMHSPVKISLSYWGGLAIAPNSHDYAAKELKEKMTGIQKHIQSSKEALIELNQDNTWEEIIELNPFWKGGYLPYLMGKNSGQEGYGQHPTTLPLECGYLVIDKQDFVWPFPNKGPCEWLLYEFAWRINRTSRVSVITPIGFHERPKKKNYAKSRPIPVETGVQTAHYGPEGFPAGDPYFAQGVIGSLEDNDFRITSIEEDIEFDPNKLQALYLHDIK